MTDADTTQEEQEDALFIAQCRYKLAAALQLKLIDYYGKGQVAVSTESIAEAAVHNADCLLAELGLMERA